MHVRSCSTGILDLPGHYVAFALPQSLVPMQPMLRTPFHRSGRVYDEKYDGWRMVVFKDSRRVR